MAWHGTKRRGAARHGTTRRTGKNMHGRGNGHMGETRCRVQRQRDCSLVSPVIRTQRRLEELTCRCGAYC